MPSPIKVLFISYDGLTDPLGQSQVLPYLEGLSQAGYEITVLSAEKRENFARRASLIGARLKARGLRWAYIFYTKKPPVFSTLWDLRQMRRRAIQLHRQSPFALLHCRSYLSALLGEYFQRRWNVPFIFDMRGFWADERVEGGLWNLRNPLFKWIYRYFKNKEKDFLQKAAHTISLTHEAQQVMATWHLPQASPVAVIPCCVDLEVFRPPVSPPAKGFALAYLGSIGTWYMLDEMLLFFARLRRLRPEARFLFITTEAPAPIQARAQALGIPPAHLHIQAAERAEVPGWLAQSEAAIFFIKPVFSKKASSATKMGEILAMGLPVITNVIGDHRHLFAQYELGILLEELTEASFDQALQQWDRLAHIDPDALRAAAKAYFSLEKGVAAYQEVYRQVLERSEK